MDEKAISLCVQEGERPCRYVMWIFTNRRGISLAKTWKMGADRPEALTKGTHICTFKNETSTGAVLNLRHSEVWGRVFERMKRMCYG